MRDRWGKLLFLLAALLALGACASIGAPQPPSLELPKPVTDLRATRKGDRVILSWTRPTTTTDRQRIRGAVVVHICRGTTADLTECGRPVGQFTGGAVLAGGPVANKNVATRVTDSFTDTLRKPATTNAEMNPGFLTYAVGAVNAGGRSAGLSNQVHVSAASTLPPPTSFSAQVTDQGVVLAWTVATEAEGTSAHYVYRAYRRFDGEKENTLVGELPLTADPRMTLTDSNIEWEKTYFYHVEAVTELDVPGQPAMQIDGEDSADVKVFAHDVFPPGVPAGLQAAYSGPEQAPFIDLIWAPVMDADLAGYNVYRRESNKSPLKINPELVRTPAYRDTQVNAGKTFYYSVSSVDVRGNESARSDEASESTP